MSHNEKRSRAAGIDTDVLPGEGVGARRGLGEDPGRGGGYQEICSLSNFRPDDTTGAKNFAAAADPRLAELEIMGLSRMWLDIAAAIGADAFLQMWRVLDANQANWDDTGKLRIHLRRYSSYIRFQRNRYIEQLAGATPPLGLREIRRRVDVAFGEKLSKEHLSHLCRKGKIKA